MFSTSMPILTKNFTIYVVSGFVLVNLGFTPSFVPALFIFCSPMASFLVQVCFDFLCLLLCQGNIEEESSRKKKIKAYPFTAKTPSKFKDAFTDLTEDKGCEVRHYQIIKEEENFPIANRGRPLYQPYPT